MKRPDPWKKKGIYSLIYDLEEKSEPISATATFDLGTVINRLSRDWIVIGSGEKLGAKESYKGEEIRCYIVREGDLKTVREVFTKWIQKDSQLEHEKEMVIQGVLGTKDSLPIIRTENGDTLISVIVKSTVIQARFTKDNLKFIKGIDINQPQSLSGTEVFVLGQVIQTASQEWEILGRSLLPMRD